MSQISSNALPAPNSRALTVTLWTLQILVAFGFLTAGSAKLTSDPQMVAVFASIGVGQWFRYLTGLLEVFGAIGLLVPRLAFYAAAMLTLVMVGAVFTHLAILGGSPAPALILLVLSAVIAWLRRPRTV